MSWNHDHRRVAYLSMEIAIDPRMPTYAGGLGVLAGDMLRSCADLGEAVVGVTLVHRLGYFRQTLAADGAQREEPSPWRPEDFARRRDETVTVEVQGRSVRLTLWQLDVVGAGGHTVPVILLDADRPENSPADRALTDALYGDGPSYRIGQEMLLGIGGVRALRALGHTHIETFHLNEGHAAFATLELLREEKAATGRWDPAAIRQRCVFTTHTPVPAGHDQFDYGMAADWLRSHTPVDTLAELAGRDRLNMTSLALNLSHYVNGVARAHRDVSEHMFPGHPIGHITNGVHSATWTCESFRSLFDRHLPGWRDDPAMLRQALGIAAEPIWRAHAAAKARLLAAVAEASGRKLDPDVLTLGFARRSTDYKRAGLLFRDIGRLRALGKGKLQIIYAGKAHPRDGDGKQLIRHIVAAGRELDADIPVVYLANYDVALAKLVVSGVDVWLNTPLRPLEASGTSGMKAAHNGVPSLSVLDGWWIEGWVEGLTGWAIGKPFDPGVDRQTADRDDADDLYRKLETAIVPTFYGDRPRWIAIMQHAIALNASYFNTHRMVQQYVANAYI